MIDQENIKGIHGVAHMLSNGDFELVRVLAHMCTVSLELPYPMSHKVLEKVYRNM